MTTLIIWFLFIVMAVVFVSVAIIGFLGWVRTKRTGGFKIVPAPGLDKFGRGEDLPKPTDMNDQRRGKRSEGT